jgi:putative addiction module component (TIGR02574 family)
MADADRLFEDAMRLPERDREELVARLAASLDAPDLHPELGDDELTHEIERRAEEIASGRVKGVSWEQVRRKAFRGRKR